MCGGHFSPTFLLISKGEYYMMYVIFTCLVCFFLMVVTVMYTKHCHMEEAIFFLFKFFKDEIFGNNQLIDYPVFVGSDGNKIVPRLVDEEFKEIVAQFDVCYCNKWINCENRIIYGFNVSPSVEIDDAEKLTLLQKIAEKAVARHMLSYDCYISADDLTVVECRAGILGISIAKNQNGIEEIRKMKENVQNRLATLKTPQKSPVYYAHWDDIPLKNRMVWGVRGEILRKYGEPMRIATDIDSHPHALITGSSGSGKSTALLWLIGKRLQAAPDTELYLCDFKNSEDFRFLEGTAHYYTGKDCYNGIMEYYSQFTNARENGSDGKRRLLIFDEYPSFLTYLQMQDKQNKTKLVADVTGSVSEILMQGRGLQLGIWIVTQRADSTWFPNGTRDNFMVSIGLGKISKEQKAMLFPGEEIPDRIFQPGEGMLLADGMGIEEVKYPLITDVIDWKDHIVDILQRNGGGHADA